MQPSLECLWDYLGLPIGCSDHIRQALKLIKQQRGMKFKVIPHVIYILRSYVSYRSYIVNRR